MTKWMLLGFVGSWLCGVVQTLLVRHAMGGRR